MNRNKDVLITGWIRSSILVGALWGVTCHAAGKPPASAASSCGGSAQPVLSVPQPIRKIILKPVGTQVFQLPGGAPVNLASDLQTILSTSVTASSIFAPSDPQLDPCQESLELRSTVSTFQLDIAQIGVSVGFTPGGSIGQVTGITGQATAQIGQIAMDFGIYKCNAGTCEEIIASTSDQTVAGGNLSFAIDFGVINTSSSLILKTPLGSVFRKIMNNGIAQLSGSSRVNLLPWQAQVKDYVPASGTVVFNSGFEDMIRVNQAFTIYAPASTSVVGTCDPYEVVSQVHTIEVDTVSSMAITDKPLVGGRGILPGDIVMIRAH